MRHGSSFLAIVTASLNTATVELHSFLGRSPSFVVIAQNIPLDVVIRMARQLPFVSTAVKRNAYVRDCIRRKFQSIVLVC